MVIGADQWSAVNLFEELLREVSHMLFLRGGVSAMTGQSEGNCFREMMHIFQESPLAFLEIQNN